MTADVTRDAHLRQDLHAHVAAIVDCVGRLHTSSDEEALQRVSAAAAQLEREVDALFSGAGQLRTPRPERSGPTKVVVVDDDDELRAFLKLTLAESDFDVREASAGPEGLLLIDADPPALVLLDWHMPTQPGSEVLEELKSRWPELPVVVLTAESRASVRAQAEAQGVDAFLRKPFSPAELLETIERVLGESPLRHPV